MIKLFGKRYLSEEEITKVLNSEWNVYKACYSSAEKELTYYSKPENYSRDLHDIAYCQSERCLAALRVIRSIRESIEYKLDKKKGI